jgi:hypothetical protein
VDPIALQRRLPAPWRVAPVAGGAHRGTNLLVIFSDVLLRQEPGGAPSPDAVNRYVALLAPAAHPGSEEQSVFMLRVYSAHQASIPGRFRNAAPASVWREHSEVGTGLRAVCVERFVLHPDGGGVVDLRLRYERGTPVRQAWPTTMRSAADPAIVRLYDSEALIDIVHSIPAGIDRVEEYRLHVAVPELQDLFNGSEHLVSLAAVPWFLRRESEGR